MASEQDLNNLLIERAKVWTPTELCNALGVHVIELRCLVKKSHLNIQVVNADKTGNQGKIFLGADYE